MKVGDKVATIGHFAGLEGVVTRVEPGVSIVDHGLIEFRVTKTNDQNFRQYTTPVGGLEHFPHFQWDTHLEVIQ